MRLAVILAAMSEGLTRFYEYRLERTDSEEGKRKVIAKIIESNRRTISIYQNS